MKVLKYMYEWTLEKFNILSFLAIMVGCLGVYLRFFFEVNTFRIFGINLESSYLEHIIAGLVFPSYLLIWQPLGAVDGCTGAPKDHKDIYLFGGAFIIASIGWEYRQYTGVAHYAAEPGTFQFLQLSGDILGVCIWAGLIMVLKKFYAQEKEYLGS